MKNNYRRTMLVTSLLILVPLIIGLLFWSKLPSTLATHFGLNNQANGWLNKNIVVWGLPVLMLILQWFVGVKVLKQKVNHKFMIVSLWLIPLISTVVSFSIYAFNLGYHVKIGMIITLLLGIILILIGNFLPKVQPNHAAGIRLPWTLSNSENWRKTNRFAGWVSVLSGLVLMVLSFYQIPWLVVPVLIAVGILPIIYSYYLAKKNS